MGDSIAVAEAARRLGVSPGRVRAMISAGRLRGERPNRDLFVDPDDVLRILKEPRNAGRHLSARSCWRLLMLAEGIVAGESSREEQRRDRARLAALPDLEPGVLAARASTHQLVGNRGVLHHLLEDSRVVLGGLSAAAQYGADIVGGGLAEGYADASALSALLRDYALSSKPLGEPANVIIRVPEPQWPFQQGAKYAPAAVVGADLIDHGDERSVRAGRLLISSLVSPTRS